MRTTRRSADDSRSNPLAEADTLAPTPPAAPEDGRTSVAGRLERDLASRRFPSLWLVVVVLVLAVAVAVAALAGNRDAAGGGSPPSLDGPSNGASSPVAAPLEAPSVEPVPVEVRVRTDVVGGELYIDGVARGPAPSGEDKVVDLAPGPYRFEIRSGGSVVAAELVILRAGEPRAVDLRVPAGAGQVEPGAAASGDAGGPSLEDPIRPRLRGLRLGDAPDDPPAPSLPTAPEVAPPDRGVPLPPRKGGPTPRPRPSAPGAPPAAPAPPPGPAPTAVPGGG